MLCKITEDVRRRSFIWEIPDRNFFIDVFHKSLVSCPPRRWVIDGLKARVFKIGEQ
jgi:hypothetical protein